MIARMECSKPARWSAHGPQDLRRPQQSTQRSSLAPNAGDYFLPRAVALLIRVAALLASASFSKPNSAEYLRPTICAITKLMLIPASPIALAIAWPSPGRLSPSTSRVEMEDGARPAVCAAATDFLPEIGYSSMAALFSPPG